MDNRILSQYLAKYIEQESLKISSGVIPDDLSILEDWIEQGIDAFRSINDIPESNKIL